MACAAFGVLLAGAGCNNGGTDAARALVLESSPVRFVRENPAVTTQGRLRFRGGLELKSTDRDFGGLSSLLVSADGSRFVAVTDEAHWVTGHLDYRDGHLVAARGESIAPMLDLDGRPMQGKAGDAEGMASSARDDIGGDIFVSFEGEHRIWRYAFERDGLQARAVEFPLPAEAAAAPHNGGIEALLWLDDGLLLAASERQRDEAGDWRAWLLPFADLAPGAKGFGTVDAPGLLLPEEVPRRRALAMRPHPPYFTTDARRLPGGDLLLLERRFDTTKGVGIRLRRIPLAAVTRARQALSGAPLDGEVVAELDPRHEIDNMEGLAVRRGPRGETLVYLVSDDNFIRTMQRTLLLMFELTD